MKKPCELDGKRFGKLTAVKRVSDKIYPSGRHDIVYQCLCDCGQYTDVLAVHLNSGHTRSCGCLRAETTSKNMTTHGQSSTRLFTIWKNMKSRCTNPNNPCFNQYGGRGITVCDAWIEDFAVFYDWSIKHGYNDDLSIDRVNVNGDYDPDNCRWVSQKTQCNNTRRNIMIEHDGELRTAKQWSDELGIKYGTLISRIRRGWDVDRALSV